jgi:hypothetical protein
MSFGSTRAQIPRGRPSPPSQIHHLVFDRNVELSGYSLECKSGRTT